MVFICKVKHLNRRTGAWQVGRSTETHGDTNRRKNMRTDPRRELTLGMRVFETDIFKVVRN